MYKLLLCKNNIDKMNDLKSNVLCISQQNIAVRENNYIKRICEEMNNMKLYWMKSCNALGAEIMLYH